MFIEKNEFPCIIFSPQTQDQYLIGKSKEFTFPKSKYSNIPNLLLDSVGKLNHNNSTFDEICQSIEKDDLTVLIGPSGCGKTANLYEFMNVNAGIYLTVSNQLNGGSNDLDTILKEVENLGKKSLQL